MHGRNTCTIIGCVALDLWRTYDNGLEAVPIMYNSHIFENLAHMLKLLDVLYFTYICRLYVSINISLNR